MSAVSYPERALKRFWSKVVRGEPAECWRWIAGAMPRGYGHFRSGGASVPQTYAHRFSYEIHHGPIPSGMYVCHKCDVPACVNPAHLFLGTHLDNIRDMVSKGRQAAGDRNGARSRPDRVKHGADRAFAKLTDAAVKTMRREYFAGRATQVALAKRFGVSRAAVYLALSGKTWRHVL